MSLIGTAIGALVALLPAVRPDKSHPLFVAGYDAGLKDGRLDARDEKLARSQARLVDHIETLEREILIEQHLCQHWKEEAERLSKHAREQREAREAAERDRDRWRDFANAIPHSQALQQMAQSQQNVAMAQQPQLAAQAQYNSAQNPQAQLAYQNPQGLQQQAFGGFCNCVPSRAQVWGASRNG